MIRHLLSALNSNSMTTVITTQHSPTNNQILKDVGTEVELKLVSWKGEMQRVIPGVLKID